MRKSFPRSRGFRAAGLVAALVSLGLAAGCIGGDARALDEALVGRTVAGPPQQEARIAAVVVRPKGFDCGSFVPAQSKLVTVREDGSGLQVIVATGGAITGIASPSWSPDGGRIYFVGFGQERERRDLDQVFHYSDKDVYVVSADGGKPRRLTTTRDVQSVAVSPDGRRLLVTRDERPGYPPEKSSLWLLASNGRIETELVPAAEGRADHRGSWSPDGRTIAFTRCRRFEGAQGPWGYPTCGIYAVSPDGTGLRELAGRSSDPAFSPNGQLIVFASDRDENGKIMPGGTREFVELYVMDSDGRNQRRLTVSAGISKGEPSWSPDGRQLAYTSTGQPHRHRQLMVMNPNGTCPRRLAGNAYDRSPVAESFTSPAWRPGRFTGPRPPLTCKR